MGTPLKVSDSLFAVAKQEAHAASRSITAQVEYWAKIGRAVEALVAHRELLTLKKAGELLTPVFPSAARRHQVHDLLMRLTASGEREPVKAELRAVGKPMYATDKDHPGMIVEVGLDGKRRVGRLVGRRFVPSEERSRSGAR